MQDADLELKRQELAEIWQGIQGANQKTTSRINNIIWAALMGAIVLVSTLGGVIYSVLNDRVQALEAEVARRAFIIQHNESKNEAQDRELESLEDEMRRNHTP